MRPKCLYTCMSVVPGVGSPPPNRPTCLSLSPPLRGSDSGAETFAAEGAKAQVRDALKCQIYKVRFSV